MTQIKQDPLVYKLWSGRQQLNREQREAVEIAVQNKFQLIQGPPGNDFLYFYIHLYIISVQHICWVFVK